MRTSIFSKLSLAGASLFGAALLAAAASAQTILIDDFSTDLTYEVAIDSMTREFSRDAASGLVMEILTVERNVDSSSPKLLEAICNGTVVHLELEEEGIVLELIGIDYDRQDRDRWGERETFRFAVEREMKESGEKGGTTDMNIGLGELQECTLTSDGLLGDANLDGEVNAADDSQAAAGDADLDGDFDSDDLNQALTGDFNGDGEVSGADF